MAAILKRYSILFFSGIMVFDSAYIYGSNFVVKFLWESAPPPLGTNGSKSTLVT